MKYLLDTNVVSALRVRGRNRPVEVWAASVPVGDQFVSAFTIAEIERGVIAKERSDADQGAVLRRWLDENVLPAFADRVLHIGFPSTHPSTTPSSPPSRKPPQ